MRSLCELSMKCLQFDGQTVEQGANTRFSGDIGEVKNLPGEPILNVHAHHVLLRPRRERVMAADTIKPVEQHDREEGAIEGRVKATKQTSA